MTMLPLPSKTGSFFPSIAAFLALSLISISANAAGQGLSIVAGTPARNGSATVLVEVSSPQVKEELRLSTSSSKPIFQPIVKNGQASLVHMQALATANETVYSVLAFDASASFVPHLRNSLNLANSFIDNLPSQIPHKISVMSFGVGSASQEASTPTEMHAALDALGKRPAQAATRLKSSIVEAIQLASDRQTMPKGIRQVIVFTDAGEESSAYSIASLVKQARSLGVRVHVVVFPNAGQKGSSFAQYRDELRLLAEGSGGEDLSYTDAQTATAALSKIAKSSESTYRLELRFCGVAPLPANFDEDLTIEALSASKVIARSNSYLLNQQAGGLASLACTSPAVIASAVPGASAAPVSNTSLSDPSSSKSLLPLLLGTGFLFLATLGGLLIWGLAGRKRDKAPSPQPAPVARQSYLPPMRPSQVHPADPFVSLPDLRLLVTRGLNHPPYFRLNKGVVRVGASPDMDLVLDLEMVSGHHATFELFPDGTAFLSDNSSRNGTYVDGIRVPPGERKQLFPGQRIGISRFLEFVLEHPDQPARVDSPSNQALIQVPSSADKSQLAASPGQKGKTIIDSPEWKEPS